MMNKEIRGGLTEKLADWSFNACLCLEAVGEGDYQPVYVNKAFERMFAITSEELSRRTFCETLSLKYGEKGLDNFRRLVEGISGTEEPQMEVFYDELKKLYLRVLCFAAAEGYLCLILLDITGTERSREKVERLYEELSASEQELRYQLDLLSITQSNLDEIKRIYRLVSENSTDGFIYYHYFTKMALTSNRWLDMFPVSEENIGNLEEVASYLEESFQGDYIEQWKRTVREQKTTERFFFLF